MDFSKPRYERRGKCNQCGWCCSREDCNNLQIIDGKAVCTIHPSIVKTDNRELKCGRFPQAPPILYEKCGYYFIDTWENNRIVRAKEV